jgi:DNA-binding transcriptional LysR family regulator
MAKSSAGHGPISPAPRGSRHSASALRVKGKLAVPGLDFRSKKLTDWSTNPMSPHVVYPPNRHLSNKLRVFVDWIADLFAGGSIARQRTGR